MISFFHWSMVFPSIVNSDADEDEDDSSDDAISEEGEDEEISKLELSPSALTGLGADPKKPTEANAAAMLATISANFVIFFIFIPPQSEPLLGNGTV
jgi:hypothetical protein